MPDPAVVVAFPELPKDAIIRRRRGRPKVVGLRPTIEQAGYEAEVARLRDKHVQADPLVEILDPQEGPQDAPDETIDLLIQGVGEEAAAIAYEARTAEKKARADAAQVISRRIDALGKLAALVRDREALRRERGHLNPKMIEQAKQLFLAGVEEVAEEVLGPDQAAKFVAEVGARLAKEPR